MTAYSLSLSLFLIAAYAGFSWHYFGQWRGVAGWPQRAHLEQGLLGGLLLAHAWLLFSPWLLPGPAVLGVGQALSMVMWLMLLIYWTGRFFYKLDGLPVFILPFAALAVLSALILPGRPIPHQLYTPDFALHLIVSMLAYSLLAIGALLALLMLVLERALHAKRRTPAMRNLPPLLSLEQLMFQAIGWGFGLLTLSLASGVLFSEQLFGVAAVVNHKIVFGVLSWLLFGALLVGRRRHGWRGRLAVRWTLASFALLLFAYIGSKIVIELILHRV